MDIPTKDRLYEALVARNMKAIDLSKATGLSRGAISQWLSGKANPKQDKIYIMSKALNVSAAWLMGKDVPMNESITSNNISIGTNNGAVSGSGNATVVKESTANYGAVQGECMRLIEALFGDSPEALTYIKSLKISQSGKIEGLENIDVTSKALLDGARTTWIAALRNALEKGTDRGQIPV